MSPADRKLCEDVADLWQSAGGDAEGIVWCWHYIYTILKERETGTADEEGGAK